MGYPDKYNTSCFSYLFLEKYTLVIVFTLNYFISRGNYFTSVQQENNVNIIVWKQWYVKSEQVNMYALAVI